MKSPIRIPAAFALTACSFAAGATETIPPIDELMLRTGLSGLAGGLIGGFIGALLACWLCKRGKGRDDSGRR